MKLTPLILAAFFLSFTHLSFAETFAEATDLNAAQIDAALQAKPATACEPIKWAEGSIWDALNQARCEGKNLLVLAYVFGCERAAREQKILEDNFSDLINENFVAWRGEMNTGVMNYLSGEWNLRGSPSLVIVRSSASQASIMFGRGVEDSLKGERTKCEIGEFFEDNT